MHTVHRQGAGAGGRVSPRAHSPWSPQLIADVPFLYTAEEQAHMGAACCTVRLTVSHMKKKEEAGICWTGMWNAGGGGDMLERDAECGRRWRLECDLCH